MTPSSKRSRWQVVAFLMALCFISHMNRVSISVAANQRLMGQYSITPTQMGSVYSAFLFVYTIFMIPGGLFIDRVGPRRALAFMGIASGCFGILTGFIGFGFVIGGHVLLTMLIVRGVMGFCTTPLHPGCARAVDSWIPLPQRSLANGLVNGAALLGIACTYRVFGALINRFDWPGAFFVISAVTIALAVGWYFWTNDPSQAPNSDHLADITQEARPSWGFLIRNKNLILLTFSYAAVGYFQYLFFYWMEYYFEQVLKLGDTRSQFYAGLPSLAMALGMPLGGWISDRLLRTHGWKAGRAGVPMAALLLSALLLMLGVFAKNPIWIVAWFSLALGVMGASEGSYWASAVELGRARGGMAAAIMNTGGNGGGMLAPVVTPWVSAHYGWPSGIALGAAVCVAGAICWWFIQPPVYELISNGKKLVESDQL